MFTPPLDKNSEQPKYEQLYRFIKNAVISGSLSVGARLPSKRKLAAHLQIGINTVENAYAQLVAEGYIEALEKKGYFVQFVQKMESGSQGAAASPPRILGPDRPPDECPFDLKSNAVDVSNFPFSIWSKLMREVLREDRASLLNETPPLGDMGLRLEIVRYLRDFRGLHASPEQVMLGTGTAHLLGILAELLPRQAFAVEDPGYLTASRSLRSRGIKVIGLELDHEGLRVDRLRESGAEAVFITPSHHFPIGTVMSINRRMQILKWAGEGKNRYVIEDDYDSEYRYARKPVPPLYSLDREDKVIYLNTFTRTLAPSLRMAYMVLPAALLDIYWKRFGFHACSVSGFEQAALARFMRGGFYERHLSRMRNIYKKRQNILLSGLAPLADSISISGGEAGLHLLIRAERAQEKELILKARRVGVKVYGLSICYLKRPPETNTVMAGYGGLPPEALAEAAALLTSAWQGIAPRPPDASHPRRG